MKFRHSIIVFIDNFSVTYKQLLYRLIIWIISFALFSAIISPYVNALTHSADFNGLSEGVKLFFTSIIRGDSPNVSLATDKIEASFLALMNMIATNKANIIWGVIGLVLVYAVGKFFTGLGNYATAAIINDRMALRANSPFILTLVRNLKEACLYNLMYVPMSLLYDGLCGIMIYAIVFKLLALIPFINLLLEIFIFVTATVFAISVKMTFTSDWLPALVRGKAGQKKAFLYTFDRRGKQTFNVLSNFVVLVLIIFGVNVAGAICTLGAGILLTVPSSYVLLLTFEFVNYYDREELKYFIDKNTVIKPEKERTLTREEFFKGE